MEQSHKLAVAISTARPLGGHARRRGVELSVIDVDQTDSRHVPAFNEAFEAKPRFARLVRAAPRWQLTGKDVTVPGLAVALGLHPAVRGRAEPAFA